MQLILGIFCVVFGGTLAFMKKEQIVDLLCFGKSYMYEGKLYKLDKIVVVMRILGVLVLLVGLYICGIYAYYFWNGI